MCDKFVVVAGLRLQGFVCSRIKIQCSPGVRCEHDVQEFTSYDVGFLPFPQSEPFKQPILHLIVKPCPYPIAHAALHDAIMSYQ